MLFPPNVKKDAVRAKTCCVVTKNAVHYDLTLVKGKTPMDLLCILILVVGFATGNLLASVGIIAAMVVIAALSTS
jgi:hypothetical protein